MLICIAILAAVAITIPATFALARWIDGDAGYIIRRRQELVRQGGFTHDQAEEQARKELCDRKYR